MRNEEDFRLARAASAGDEAAFTALYALYLPRVLSFSRKRRSGNVEAAALARAILEAVFHHLDGYSGETALAPWVLAVAKLVEKRAETGTHSAAA